MTGSDTDPRRWRATWVVHGVCPVILFFLATSVCEAQIVVGQLYEGGSRTPVDGALVVLVRENGAEEDGYLTNSAGRFPVSYTHLRAHET